MSPFALLSCGTNADPAGTEARGLAELEAHSNDPLAQPIPDLAVDFNRETGGYVNADGTGIIPGAHLLSPTEIVHIDVILEGVRVVPLAQ
jgi:hypothetical protein